jgi:hypothetical protein
MTNMSIQVATRKASHLISPEENISSINNKSYKKEQTRADLERIIKYQFMFGFLTNPSMDAHSTSPMSA